MTKRRKHQAIAATEDTLIRRIRERGRLSRGELAAQLGLVPSTIGVYVERLVLDGFLLESIPEERGLGRPPILLDLNPSCGRFIGLDFDARQIRGVATDFAQQPLAHAERVLQFPTTSADSLAAMGDLIEELIGSDPADVLGIGVGVPGFVDPDLGVGLRASFIPDWKNIPVAQCLQNRFNIPVWIENNLRALALAEFSTGRGSGISRLACLGVRTGIGLGMVIDGRLYRGATNSAGEIGLWACPEIRVDEVDGAAPQITATTKTIQEMASVTALLTAAENRLRRGDASCLQLTDQPLTIAEFLKAVAEDDDLACELVTKVAVQHGWIAHHLSLVLDPDLIIFAGPLIEAPRYLATVQQTCHDIDGESLSERVVRSELGPFGGALGAAAVAAHSWTPRGVPSRTGTAVALPKTRS